MLENANGFRELNPVPEVFLDEPPRRPRGCGDSVSGMRRKLESMFSEDSDAERELAQAEEAAEALRAAREAEDARRGEVESYRDEVEGQGYRSERLAAARAAEIDYAKSRTRTAERNIEYAENEYRAATEAYGRASAAAAAAGADGWASALASALYGDGGGVLQCLRR